MSIYSPDEGGGQAHSWPWRTVGVGAVSLGAPVGTGVLHPVLGGLIAAFEAMMVLAIIGTALFGSLVLSERAFRLLRWIGNRAEPPNPGAHQR
jgi:hypothetical protein